MRGSNTIFDQSMCVYSLGYFLKNLYAHNLRRPLGCAQLSLLAFNFVVLAMYCKLFSIFLIRMICVPVICETKTLLSTCGHCLSPASRNWFSSCHSPIHQWRFFSEFYINQQLLNETEQDMKNSADQGECYPQPRWIAPFEICRILLFVFPLTKNNTRFLVQGFSQSTVQ